MRTRTIIASNAPTPPSRYAQAVETVGAERWLFISGQIPVTKDGDAPTAFVDQARLCWANVEAQLAAAGMTLDHLVKHTTFLADRRYAAENRRVRLEVLGERDPALTVVIADIFDEAWLLEIEAIAAA